MISTRKSCGFYSQRNYSQKKSKYISITQKANIMKNLILISYLFVFTFSLGQTSDKFDFYDIKNINNAKLWKKFCFEKEFIQVENNAFLLKYAKGYNKEEKIATEWATYYHGSKTFYFQFSRNYDGSSRKSFELILTQVKKLCKFYGFKNDLGDEFICYSCPNSSYLGKIGFLRNNDGSDYIQTFDF